MRRPPAAAAAAAAAALLRAPPRCAACTSVRTGGDFGGGSEVIARSMEVGEGPPLTEWNLTTYPRGQLMGNAHLNTGADPGLNTIVSFLLCNITSSMHWRNQHSFVAVEAGMLETAFVPDGMNEHGLTVSAQTLRTTQYPSMKGLGDRRHICHVLVVPYLLGNCKTIEEAKAAVASVAIVDPVPVGKTWMFHYDLSDATGAHAVLEFIRGEPHWYDNTVGVMTNDPPYPWHVANLDNYAALAATEATPDAQQPAVGPAPLGSNLFGLPGDLTPPSRFVRMFYLRKFALRWAREKARGLGAADDEALLLAQSLINTVHIVEGTVAAAKEKANAEMTHWVALKVPAKRHFYIRTYGDMAWRLVDLSNFNPAVRHTERLEERRITVANVTAAFTS